MSDPTAPCPFYVGQKVTPCTPVNHPLAIAEGIRTGGVYTISDMYAHHFSDVGACVMLLFKDMPVLPSTTRPPRGGWIWTGFKPVNDISSLQALLNTKPVDVPKEELV